MIRISQFLRYQIIDLIISYVLLFNHYGLNSSSHESCRCHWFEAQNTTNRTTFCRWSPIRYLPLQHFRQYSRATTHKPVPYFMVYRYLRFSSTLPYLAETMQHKSSSLFSFELLLATTCKQQTKYFVLI